MSKSVLFLLLGAALGFFVVPAMPFSPIIGAILGLAFGGAFAFCEWIAAKKRDKPPAETPVTPPGRE